MRTIQEVVPRGVTTVLYDGLARLPAFNPDEDRDPLHPAVSELREQVTAADAVVFSTPEYAGTLPGSFKNLLDWVVGSGALHGKPAAWVNVAAEGRGTNAHSAMLTVLEYLGPDIIDAACVRAPVARDAVGQDGTVLDTDFRERVARSVHEFRNHLAAA
ncbi:NAD(P)H-dependent FMN reductase [Lipingzhangella halophila]|uniref:NAD(P)H-dependent FMN reductase n=2 Tax=Lipingzhangella halophila TaxID=1783352 RepID=A0A7W7RFS0_9ACTN|nr:NAD(P)H-dependent FMN reductase [Lipingzhangella halophila]